MVGKEDSIPIMFGEYYGVVVVDRFECGQGPGGELRGSEVGVAKQGRVEVEDHVEFVATVIHERVGLSKGCAGRFTDGHGVVL